MQSPATVLASRDVCVQFSVLISGWQLLYYWRLPYFIQRNIKRSTERPEKWVCWPQSTNWNQFCCSERRGKMRLYLETWLIYDSQTTYWECPVAQAAQVCASRTGATVWVRNSEPRRYESGGDGVSAEQHWLLCGKHRFVSQPNCLIGGRGRQRGKCRQVCGRQTMENHFGDNGSRLSVYESFSRRHADKHTPPAARVHFTGIPAAARSLFSNIIFSCPGLSHEWKRIQTPQQTSTSRNRRRDVVEMLVAARC